MSHLSATGYVHTMLDDKQTFEEFTWACARAFMIRDAIASIPDKFEPDSYHLTAKAQAEKQLKKFESMTEAQKLDYGREIQNKEITEYEKLWTDVSGDVKACKAMLKRVEKWVPPSSEHTHLKEFMIEQLNTSIGKGGAYYATQLTAARSRDLIAYYLKARHSAKNDVQYHARHYKEECDSVDERNKWMGQLRKSIKLPRRSARGITKHGKR